MGPRAADVLLGTSQGSLLACLLASGVGTDDLVRWYRKDLPASHPLRAKPSAVRSPGGGRGLFPRPASPWLLARAVGRDRIALVAALAGLLPEGAGSLDGFLAPLAALVGSERWVDHPATSVVAVDYDTGRRVVFGPPGPSRPSALEAVRASCTVPGSFPPVVIDGRRYVDGAVHSTTNADLLVGERLDEVVVLAPMAGEGGGLLRRVAQRQLRAECHRLAATGLTVRVLTPTAGDRAVMGADPQDPARRFAIFEAAYEGGPQ